MSPILNGTKVARVSICCGSSRELELGAPHGPKMDMRGVKLTKTEVMKDGMVNLRLQAMEQSKCQGALQMDLGQMKDEINTGRYKVL